MTTLGAWNYRLDIGYCNRCFVHSCSDDGDACDGLKMGSELGRNWCTGGGGRGSSLLSFRNKVKVLY